MLGKNEHTHNSKKSKKKLTVAFLTSGNTKKEATVLEEKAIAIKMKEKSNELCKTHLIL